MNKNLFYVSEGPYRSPFLKFSSETQNFGKVSGSEWQHWTVILRDHFVVYTYEWVDDEYFGEQIPLKNGEKIVHSISDILKIRDVVAKNLGDDFAEILVRVDIFSAYNLEKMSTMTAHDFLFLGAE